MEGGGAAEEEEEEEGQATDTTLGEVLGRFSLNPLKKEKLRASGAGMFPFPSPRERGKKGPLG